MLKPRNRIDIYMGTAPENYRIYIFSGTYGLFTKLTLWGPGLIILDYNYCDGSRINQLQNDNLGSDSYKIIEKILQMFGY